MGSNLKQEAMERVGEVKHAECYYDTDRNKPLPGTARKCATQANVIAAQAGKIAALTAEVTHQAEKLAERDAKVDRNSVRVELYRRALEIVAVGDAKQVQKHCEEALIEGGDWSAVPIALTESDDHEQCTFCGAPWGRYGCTCPKPTDTTKGA